MFGNTDFSASNIREEVSSTATCRTLVAHACDPQGKSAQDVHDLRRVLRLYWDHCQHCTLAITE
eukprot:4762913-Amphidinium_carterae.1